MVILTSSVTFIHFVRKYRAPKSVAAVISLALLSLCFSTSTHACEFKNVHFKTDFEAGRIDQCKQLSENQFELLSKPENRPINPSPWYAFKVVNKSTENQQISIVIKGEKAKPRYLPKMSIDGKQWQALPFDIIDNAIHINIQLQQQDFYIAGQEVIDNAFYAEWSQTLAKQSDFKLQALGMSTEGRGIDALVHSTPENKEWLLIVGRQHPPEITGALALISFVQELATQQQLNAEFLSRFNVMIIPNLNPDGVANGNWRHNVKGTDLNRDWGKFTQVETQQVQTWLNKTLVEQQRLVFALDFHSTQQDIFYTMPSDYAVAPSTFSEDWLKQLKDATVSSFTVRPSPGSSPGRGVFKQFLADEYNIHSITYEMGDNTNRELITHVAQTAAQTLMRKMLSVEPEQFIYKPSPSDLN
jgi:archaellum component FlaG (FlaF/FlaG flagellin family)